MMPEVVSKERGKIGLTGKKDNNIQRKRREVTKITSVIIKIIINTHGKDSKQFLLQSTVARDLHQLALVNGRGAIRCNFFVAPFSLAIDYDRMFVIKSLMILTSLSVMVIIRLFVSTSFFFSLLFLFRTFHKVLLFLFAFLIFFLPLESHVKRDGLRM